MTIHNVQNDKSNQSPQDKVADILGKKAKIELAMLASALQSIRRGLDWEHKMIEQGDLTSTQVEGVDDVGPLIVGDVSISSNQNTPKEKSNWLMPTVLAVSSLLAGGGVTAAIMSAMQGSPPPQKVIVSPSEDKDTQYSIEFATPKHDHE